VSSPHAPLHNRDVREKRRAELIDSGPSLLNYGRKQPLILSSWDGVHHALSIFRIDETSKIDAINIVQSISRIINYIKSSLVDKKLPVKDFKQVTKSFWSLITAIYSSRWDLLPVEDGKTFCDLIGERILNSYVKRSLLNQPEAKKPLSSIPTNATNLNVPVTPPPSKITGPNEKKALKPMIIKKSYAQTSKTNISSSIKDVI